MASAKRTAKKIEDADLGAAIDEVEAESKVTTVNRAPSNSGRPNDNPIQKYSVPNSTFAQRAQVTGKRQATAANKAVTTADNK